MSPGTESGLAGEPLKNKSIQFQNVLKYQKSRKTVFQESSH